MLTAGSNQLLHLVGEVLFDPGDIVLCAAPTYFVFLGLLDGLGARAVGVAIDEDGMIPEALEETLARLKQAGERAAREGDLLDQLFRESQHGHAVGRAAAADRRDCQATSVDGHLYVIDDAAYRELRYAGDDLPSLRAFDETGDTVIVAETFSKSFSPGIRVGWGVLPPALVGPVVGTEDATSTLARRI